MTVDFKEIKGLEVPSFRLKPTDLSICFYLLMVCLLVSQVSSVA
jgi:hypothetical protein